MKEGERGIIYGIRADVKKSHVFNIIKVDGLLLVKEGQSGIARSIGEATRYKGYIKFEYLKTN